MPLVLNLLLYQPLSHQILKTFQLLNPINFQNKDPKNVLRPGPNLIQSVYFNMLMFAYPVLCSDFHHSDYCQPISVSGGGR